MAQLKPEVEKMLLTDRRVVEEIQRHLWIESEKAGFNIGFEKASEDWLKNFSRAWMQYNLPDALRSEKTTANNDRAIKLDLVKRRRAKSYLR